MKNLLLTTGLSFLILLQGALAQARSPEITADMLSASYVPRFCRVTTAQAHFRFAGKSVLDTPEVYFKRPKNYPLCPYVSTNPFSSPDERPTLSPSCGRTDPETIVLSVCDQDIRNAKIVENAKFITVTWVKENLIANDSQIESQKFSATISKQKFPPLHLQEVVCNSPSPKIVRTNDRIVNQY